LRKTFVLDAARELLFGNGGIEERDFHAKPDFHQFSQIGKALFLENERVAQPLGFENDGVVGLRNLVIVFV
jgi:hypothetical protein